MGGLREIKVFLFRKFSFEGKNWGISRKKLRHYGNALTRTICESTAWPRSDYEGPSAKIWSGPENGALVCSMTSITTNCDNMPAYASPKDLRERGDRATLKQNTNNAENPV
jgi:hypothetical protein